MKLISFNFCVFDSSSKKPMATHQASINTQEPMKFKLEATRTRIEYHFQLEPNPTNSQIRAQSKTKLEFIEFGFRAQSKTKLYKFEQELSKQSEFESEPTATKP